MSAGNDQPGARVPDDTPDIAGLIRRAKANDEDAFAALYRLTVRQVYRYCSVRVAAVEDAEELTQEVYVAAVGALHTLRASDEAGLYAWLYQVARNKAADYMRRRYRNPVAPLDDATPVADPAISAEDLFALEADRAEVREALEQLTPEQREVLLCKYVLEYSNDQTAKHVGKNVNAVNQLHHRALASMARLLGRRRP